MINALKTLVTAEKTDGKTDFPKLLYAYARKKIPEFPPDEELFRLNLALEDKFFPGSITQQTMSMVIFELRYCSHSGEPIGDHGYQVGKFLWKNPQGKTFEMTEWLVTSPGTFAVKVVDKSKLQKPKQKAAIKRQLNILMSLAQFSCCSKSPNLVYFNRLFEDGENLYIFKEFCPHKTLAHLLQRRGKLTEPEVVCIIKQILTGLAYLHG